MQNEQIESLLSSRSTRTSWSTTRPYYVGNNPKESGRLCGELIAEYVAAHPEADKSVDGELQYVMLKGEPGHQEIDQDVYVWTPTRIITRDTLEMDP